MPTLIVTDTPLVGSNPRTRHGRLAWGRSLARHGGDRSLVTLMVGLAIVYRSIVLSVSEVRYTTVLYHNTSTVTIVQYNRVLDLVVARSS